MRSILAARAATLVGIALAQFAMSFFLAGAVNAAPITMTGPVILPGDAGLTASAGRDETPALARGGNTVLAVWADSRTNLFSPPPFNEEQGARDIYAARLDAAGHLIDEIPIVVNADFGVQQLPRAAWNGDHWLVVWESQEPTQFYYASTIQAARVGPDRRRALPELVRGDVRRNEQRLGMGGRGAGDLGR
jgi:hypothetical protein